MGYQNCGKAGFEEQALFDELDSASSLDPKLASVPFPYEISVNQIAHMSCPLNINPTANTTHFSWKVGAFENPSDVPTASMNIRPSGIQLRSEFLTAFENLSSGYSVEAKKDYLQRILKTHPLVGNAQIQLSFRDTVNSRTKLMQMPAGGNSPVSTILAPLSTDGLVNAIMSNPSKTHDYFPAITDPTKNSFEGKLIVPSSLGVNHSALQANYDSSHLALGFQSSSNSTQLSGSSDSKAYGKAFRVIFGTTNPKQGTEYYPSRDSLIGLNEMDLDTKANTSAGWDCSYRFKIVKSQDRYNTFYRANNFSLINGACPGPSLTGNFCASPINQQFGIANTFFPNSQCPSNRPLRTGTYCVEKYATVCPAEPYNTNSASATPYDRTDGLYNPNFPQRPQIMHALRRVLPTADWDINVSRRCIVPKNGENSCYVNAPTIVYDEFFSSLEDSNANMGRHPGCGVDIAGVGGTFPCAGYLTLCLRR